MTSKHKRGFFIFEPVIVLVFLGALLSASFISLAKNDFLDDSISTHADRLVSSYLGAETDVFMFRELRARFVVEDVIYQFAGSAGAGTDDSGCNVVGMAPRPLPKYIDVRTINFADVQKRFTDTLAFEFGKEQNSLKTQKLQTEIIPYEFIVQDPLTVVGIPLQPELIAIPLPEALREKGVSVAEYPARVSFTLRYSYPLQLIYDQLNSGIELLQTCKNQQTEAGRADCLAQKIKTLDTNQLAWELKPNSGSPTYDIDVTHQYQAPLCTNKPLTLLTINFPAIVTPVVP